MDTELRGLRIDRTQKTSLQPSRPKLRWPLFGLAGCALMATGLFAYSRIAAPVEVEVYRVNEAAAEEGSDAERIVLDATGYIVAAHKIEVASKVPGKVAWVGVQKGERVKQGQVLVRLENEEYRAQVAQAKGNADHLGARLAELEHGSRPQEIAKARADFESATAELLNYKAVLQRTRQLVNEGVLSRQSLDDARAKFEAQAGRTASFEQTYLLEKLGPREEEIAAVHAQLEQAKGGLAYVQTQLDSTIIRAPVEGTILDRNVEPGEFVTTGFVGERGVKGYVVSMADLNDLQAELDISENNFARLKPFQGALITTDAYPDRKYHGRIVEIAPEADRQKATVQVKVKIQSPDEYLRPDMNASVSFHEEPGASNQAAHTLAPVVVPPTAIRDQAVFVVLNGRAVRRAVVLSGTAAGGVKVSRGLSGGEIVIVNPQPNLKDGNRVRAR